MKIEYFHRGKTEYLTPCGFINSALSTFSDMAICKSVETNLVTFCETYDGIATGYAKKPARSVLNAHSVRQSYPSKLGLRLGAIAVIMGSDSDWSTRIAAYFNQKSIGVIKINTSTSGTSNRLTLNLDLVRSQYCHRLLKQFRSNIKG